jgi:hypothetical protein
MGRIVPPFRQLYDETMELKAALVDLGHKSAFDLLLKEAGNPEQAAMGNSTLPTVLDKLNIMSTIHSRPYIISLLGSCQSGSILFILSGLSGSDHRSFSAKSFWNQLSLSIIQTAFVFI